MKIYQDLIQPLGKDFIRYAVLFQQLKFINEEVGRRIDNLRDIDSQLQEVSEEITVDVDRIREDVQRLEFVRTQLKNMSESLQELGWIIKKVSRKLEIHEFALTID